MTTPVVFLGAGGHARVLLEAARLQGGLEVVALLETARPAAGTVIDGVPVEGEDALPAYRDKGVGLAVIAFGSVRHSGLREAVCRRVSDLGFELATIIHPAASVSPAAELGPGSCVMAGAVVGRGARLGRNVIINTGALVEHDCGIGDHTHIATGACLGGGVTVGTSSHVGLGCRVRQSIRIGERVTIGAGAVVVSDIPDGVEAWGVPARVQRTAG